MGTPAIVRRAGAAVAMAAPSVMRIGASSDLPAGQDRTAHDHRCAGVRVVRLDLVFGATRGCSAPLGPVVDEDDVVIVRDSRVQPDAHVFGARGGNVLAHEVGADG